MGIGPRLQLVLAIPLTALLVVSGFAVHRGATQAREATVLRERTDLALASYSLVEALQTERGSLVAEDLTTPELRSDVTAAADQVASLAAQVGGPLQAETVEALERVDAAGSIAERDLGGAVALRVHSTAIAALLDVAAVAIDPGDATDDAAATTTDYLARAQAASAEERDLVVLLSEAEEFDAAAFQEVMGLASAQESYVELAAASAPPALSIRITQVGFAQSAADQQRRETFEGVTDRTAVWVSGLEARTDDLASLQRTAEVGAVAAVDSLARDSRLLFVLSALAAMAIVLVSILLLRRAIRSIARPLQQLATQADDVARTRLPEAVAAQQVDGVAQVHLPALRASGAAEVHDVAGAFNAVQTTALRLAGEQAALRRNQGEALTNLGRRNQTLLARQLDFISSLETKETDPKFLEHLFRLDHLASRMRRNAESLLILAGSETPRRRRTPAPIAEIVRAAMSEVEDFERVRIGNVRDAVVTGPVVIDLIHLLAELIENALGFSPPDTTVEIDGRALGQGGYQFAIIDHGVGMSDVELLAANERLRGQDELEGMPTRYLGQYVVAKLATKTGTMVRLQPTTGGRGVTAMVILPSTALVGGRDKAAVAQPLPGSRKAREQGPVPFAPGAAMAPAAEAVLADLTAGLDNPPLEMDAPFEAAEQFDPVAQIDAPPAPADPHGFDVPVESADPFRVDVPAESADPSGAGVPVEPAEAAFGIDAATEHGQGVASDADPFGFGFFEAAPELDPGPSPAAPADGAEVPVFDRAELMDPDPAASAADPWSGFFDDPDTAEPSVDAAAPSASQPPGGLPSSDMSPPAPPPPAPSTAPVQADWVPTEPTPASAGHHPDAPPLPPSGPFEPAGEPEPAPEAAPLAPSRVGGLARRVPGASLAESRGDEIGAVATPAAARSAEGVRSMLSSFQSGRQRGRGDGADASAADLHPSSGEPFAGDPSPDDVPPGHPSSAHNSVPDGRFPQ